MTGSTIGHTFRVTTFGESHGVALGCIIDGCPPNLALHEADIQSALDRRRPGRNDYTTKRSEPDQVQILSGVFEGKTTGTPIGLLIKNQDQRSRDYDQIKHVFRPGHADWSYMQKYGIRDYRGGGRASARETVMRVAAGAIAAKYLQEELGISICAYVSQIGKVVAQSYNREQVAQNPFGFVDPSKHEALIELFEQLHLDGDSVGALIEVMIEGVPAGLGEPVFSKLDADLAGALMGINAVKAVSIGDGFDVISSFGSMQRDAMSNDGFESNHAGGILGGISTGQPIQARVAFKPTSSIRQAIQTQNMAGEVESVGVTGRHDPCVAIRAVPIVEAMCALVIMDHYQRQKAQNLNWAGSCNL